MIEVVSIKFKNRGKCYFFSPNGLSIRTGDRVIVQTAKGLEIADCCRGNHTVMENTVVQPLRPVLRLATRDDLRIAHINIQREKEAFKICQQKIAEHGLDMKLVDVECNFEGTKTMFFFTSEGRVDFRELVKDLASIFRNRIELRQIGVRDEAKMIGGIGICGRPYCCNQFLDDFQPVSTKMAKIQSLSLNPTKISGSCGRLMCCLRYEQAAYEDLIKKVPKQGAFVETKDGFGTAVQVNLLRQTVKVRLDGEGDELRTYKPNELCAVPGGRPRDGETPVSTLRYVPEPEVVEEDETPESPWLIGSGFGADESAAQPPAEPKKSGRRRRAKKQRQDEPGAQAAAEARPEPKTEEGAAKGSRSRRGGRGRAVKVEPKPHVPETPAAKPHAAKAPRAEVERPRREAAAGGREETIVRPRRRRSNRGKPRPKDGAQA